MSKLAKFILLGFIALFFAGCGGTLYSVTYATNPSGASVICDDGSSGYSPLTLHYDIRKGKKNGYFDENGILSTQSCRAVFVSGYVDYFSTKWDTKKFPKRVTQTLRRPQGEGYAQDMAFSMEYERNKMMQKQVQIQQQQANQQAWDSLNQSIQQTNQQMIQQQRNFQLQQMNNNLFQLNQQLRRY